MPQTPDFGKIKISKKIHTISYNPKIIFLTSVVIITLINPFKKINTCPKYVCHMLGLSSLPTVVLGRRERRRAEI